MRKSVAESTENSAAGTVHGRASRQDDRRARQQVFFMVWLLLCGEKAGKILSVSDIIYLKNQQQSRLARNSRQSQPALKTLFRREIARPIGFCEPDRNQFDIIYQSEMLIEFQGVQLEHGCRLFPWESGTEG
jgi:hypothetical protein